MGHRSVPPPHIGGEVTEKKEGLKEEGLGIRD
jgi:hypothetical protein